MPFLKTTRQAKSQHVRGHGERIPVTLQAVFLASNRGADVDKPPPSVRFGLKSMFGGRSSHNNDNTNEKPTTNVSGSPKQSGWLSKSSFSHNNKVTPQCNTTTSYEKSNPRQSKQYSKPGTISCILMDFPGSVSNIDNDTNGNSKQPVRKKLFTTMTPQKYLETMLVSRGYSIECYNVLQSAYYNRPTPLQEASYGVFIIDVVRRDDGEMLEALFELGLHPNACNSFGESLLHLACRRGNYNALKAMVDCSYCTVQVADDYGRTPLHDLCWAAEPCFASAALLLEIDSHLLFMKDQRGATPLTYARKEHWSSWIKFLETHKDQFWPKLPKNGLRIVAAPKLTQSGPNTRPIPNPTHAMNLRLATLVSGGKITLEEAEMILQEEQEMKTAVCDKMKRDGRLARTR